MCDAILQKVECFIKDPDLLPSSQKVIVGVSGGADSMALLSILCKLGFSCVAAHCNFHLRQDESDRDEQFVKHYCEMHHIPCVIQHFDTEKYAFETKISIEMAARDLRYQWFEQVRLKYQAQAIAIAHHADDSVETMLLNLVRGTGLKGLTGIQYRNQYVVRPLLCCTRNEIITYCQKAGIDFVQDSTNALCDYKRNKIRNQLLPSLEKLNPSVRDTLYETLTRLEGTYSLYSRMLEGILNDIVHTEGDTKVLNIDTLLHYSESEQATLLFELLHEHGFHSRQIVKAVDLMQAETGKYLTSATHRLLKNRNTLLLEALTDKRKNTEIQINSIDDELPEQFSINIFQRPEGFVPSRNPNRIHLDASKLKFPLTIRNWKQGDRFVPFGMKQSKKLSDFFIDIKLSASEKEKVQLLVSDDKIAWVIGFRPDNRFRIHEHSSEIIEISYTPDSEKPGE